MPKRLVRHLSSHLTSLLLKAAVIQKKIEEEYKSKSPNWLALVRLKKIRLKISERLYQIGGEMAGQHKLQLARVIAKRKQTLSKGI